MTPPWTLKIYTQHGFASEEILEGASTLDIGCGGRKLPGAVGVDSIEFPEVDVVHDLSVFPWPFANDSFDLIFSNHFLEHSEDVLATLGEIHRILKSGGRTVIQVPYFRSVDSVTDPTHKHFFTSYSLDYVIAGTKLSQYAYTKYCFNKIGFWYAWPQRSSSYIVSAFKSFITTHKRFYDQYLSILLPVECVTWELEKI